MIILSLTACVNLGKPRQFDSWTYLVKPTDTLYSVAWRYDIDFKSLAAWNQIKAPYLIFPGQYIRLKKPNGFIKNKTNSRGSSVVLPKQKKPLKKINNQPLKWMLPVKGRLLNKFSFNDINKRGINIASDTKKPVVAVLSGKVVYSGNGLEGYKNLIIIKHNETYLSAYAQNKNLLVKEGDVVKKGKKIADMGIDNEHGFLLHFQIRKNGKPVNPMRYLPKI